MTQAPTNSQLHTDILVALRRDAMTDEALAKRVSHNGRWASKTARQAIDKMLADGLLSRRWGKLRLTARGLLRIPSEVATPA